MKTHWKCVLSARLGLGLLFAIVCLLIYTNPAGAYQENQQPAPAIGGRGAGLSDSEQLRLIRINADQGNPVAQFSLGFSYANGRGVDQDYVQAYMWLTLSIENTTERYAMPSGASPGQAARDLRESIAMKMTPGQIEEAEQLAREWKPKYVQGRGGGSGNTQPLRLVRPKAEPGSESEFDLLFDDASLNFRQGQYEKAIKLYKEANHLKEDKSPECLWGLAQAYDKLGAYKNVQRTCEMLIEACIDDPGYRAMAWNLIGNTLSNNAMKDHDKPDQKKLGEAEHAYREVLLISPESQAAHYNLGVTLIRMNRISQGIEEMQACIRSGGDENLAEKARKTIEDPRRAIYDFVPDFSVVTSDGEYITSDELVGKVILLDFWGSWCGPCRNAVPDLKRLAQKYSGENFILVSIDVNEPEEKWLEFLEENKMNWTQVRDDKSSLQRTFQVSAFPTYILIDHEGIIQKRMLGGGSQTYGQIVDEVKKALKHLENSPAVSLQGKQDI